MREPYNCRPRIKPDHLQKFHFFATQLPQRSQTRCTKGFGSSTSDGAASFNTGMNWNLGTLPFFFFSGITCKPSREHEDVVLVRTPCFPSSPRHHAGVMAQGTALGTAGDGAGWRKGPWFPPTKSRAKDVIPHLTAFLHYSAGSAERAKWCNLMAAVDAGRTMDLRMLVQR